MLDNEFYSNITMNNINMAFKHFCEEYALGKITFLARPDQDLASHITNMLIEFQKYFNYLPKFSSQYDDLLYFTSLFAILIHDFGKLNPYFQFKIRLNPSLRKELVKSSHEFHIKSYHSQLSTLFAITLINVIFDLGHDVLNSVNNELNTSFQNFLNPNHKNLILYTLTMIVFFHHSNIFGNRRKYIDNLSPFECESLNEIIQLFYKILDDNDNKPYLQFISNLFNKLNEALKSNPDLKFRIPIELICDITKNLVAESKNISLSDNFFNYSIAENIFDEIEEIISKDFNLNETPSNMSIFDIYIFTSFIASLLFDLDIWDARFHNTNRFDFFQKISINSFNLVQNYVSEPFGQINPNFSGIRLTKPSKPIELLRNILFTCVNNENLEPRNIYIINSPTGAGKTLTLLNAAFKIAKKFNDSSCKTQININNSNRPIINNNHSNSNINNINLNSSNFTPKIIYGLPFVSIGSQVAEQISKLFNLSLSAINSPIKCEDNYLSTDVWLSINNPSQSQIDPNYLISGFDARWLISTWQSLFVVTTFVKIFESLLKPFKFNLLKIHRFAHSVLILDEIQCIPIKYWKICSKILESCKNVLNCSIILSTATLPSFILPKIAVFLAKSHLNQPCPLPSSYNNIPPNRHNSNLGSLIDRYDLFYYPNRLKFSNFLSNLKKLLSTYNNQDILIVLNTIEAVVNCFHFINDLKLPHTDIFVLSTLVLPKHRLNSISKIKKHLLSKLANNNSTPNRVIVISTQLIEAGVDLSFNLVIRDLAPIDSIVQVAGRCNRNMEFPSKGKIHLVHLIRDNAKKSDMNLVYKINNLLQLVDNFLLSAANYYSKYFQPNIHKSPSISNKKSIDPQFPFGKPIIINEISLRNCLQSYYNEITSKNLATSLTKELTNLDFQSLATKFSLIDYKPYNCYLLPLISQEACQIHSSILEQKFPNFKLPKNFFLNILLISNKIKNKLSNLCKIIPIIQKSDNSVLYYAISKTDFFRFYSENHGLLLS
ncbi:MAG: DEAD/DEAH box helicase [Promethearchaeota archaeon]